MDVDQGISRIAGAIGDPARARMLNCLMDQRARTSTELAVVAGVSPSTASVHLTRLRTDGLVRVQAQGKHRYYTLAGEEVASVLEGLSVLAGDARKTFVPTTPNRLRAARTCYDHIAGSLGVALHDRLQSLEWLEAGSGAGDYELTAKGRLGMEKLDIDVEEARKPRRRFAYGCLDWSERRPHVGGALGAAFLQLARKRRWIAADLDSRILSVTARGKRELASQLGLEI